MECPDPCSACPAGRCSESSLDRYRLIGVNSCTECPPGPSKIYDGARVSGHDNSDDCTPCEPGSFNSEVGMKICSLCLAGRYSREFGSLSTVF
mmetsp:Transcript_8009/g.24658  ORF Transcript_8009/g.24658 Transcript_8009/m.24658 type:complete len:93 (-) Transcript_8009:9-287(-)